MQNIYTDGRATVSGWAAYKRQTGSLPWSSIGIHFLKLGCNSVRNGFPTLVQRKIWLVAVTVCRHPCAGSGALWRSLVLGKEQSKGQSGPKW
jgi:hypothetical protein